MGPAEKNYRCYTGWVPTTGAERISDKAVFVPPRKYTYLSNFSGLQQMSDITNSAAKKASDSKYQESQRVTPPNIPGGQRVGPNIIEDDSEDTTQQLRDNIKEK